ncbi:MAG: ferrous iron transport protein B [Paludibacteraceae bacterium]|nr:ferrous iron transport protein B [Paludibacteraceae bacterium]
MTTLADLQIGEEALIVKTLGQGGFRHRIMELGFVRGEKVKALKNAPLQDPIEYEIMGSHVSLRRREAENIEIVPLSEKEHQDFDFHGTLEEHIRHEFNELSRTITVALVGNPNCGKTSFFNYAAGMREKVGNYGGVTVDAKIGTFKHKDYTIHLVDLPGTYSLTEYSPEEMYVRDYLDNQPTDLVLNIVNAGNLERNLFLTTQLIDRNQPMVMALNMWDELQQSGDTLDTDTLGKLLGFPIVPVIARTGWGIDHVLEAIVSVYEGRAMETKHIHIRYSELIEQSIEAMRPYLNNEIEHPRYVALKLLEADKTTLNKVKDIPQLLTIAQEKRKLIEETYKEDISTIISDEKYGFIRGALSETLSRNKEKEKEQLGYSLDKVLTNRWLGFPILILFLLLMFEATFVFGGWLQDLIDSGIGLLSDWVQTTLGDGMLTDLLVDGVIGGAGAVLVFVPQILILFFFIAILEDTGYMARAAFIMDKLMHRMGLHGKSFIPYIVGLGCTVPAVLSARTLENPRDRILTIITLPFVSCSARLPVYLVLIAAFFPNHQALILLAIYLIGLLFAILTSLIVGEVKMKKENNPFVMELPPYRIPTLRNATIHMWDKAKEWLKRVSTIVLLASVIIWALGYFPHHDDMSNTEQLEVSYLGKIGHTIEPVFRPMGLEWRAGVSLIAGCAAKEVIASSMAVLYGVDDTNPEEDNEPLAQKLAELTDDNGNLLYTPIAAFAMMLFVLLYFPCISTLATIRSEIGRGWMWFTLLYSTGLAWVVATVFYQIANLI